MLLSTAAIDNASAEQAIKCPHIDRYVSGLQQAVGSSNRSWTDYQIIIWQQETSSRLTELSRLGVTAGAILSARDDLDQNKIPIQVAPFSTLGLHWYVENIATDFYSSYHRWSINHPPTWLFDQIRKTYLRNPNDIAAFIRDPSLSDPVWLRRIVHRLTAHVRAYSRYRPLFYDLADEAGIADLATPWDFDFAPVSLSGMRDWLRGQYRTLAALNSEWGTQYRNWRAVVPLTTDAAITRSNENFAGWNDFKEWMDVAFARAVRIGTQAVHRADPNALAALEGAQIPGWGGYNYERLAPAVDVMELYDFGNNVNIVRSIAPNVITLTTSALAGPEDLRAVWHELLLGGRGLILWDPHGSFVDEDGKPSASGRVLETLATEIRSGLGEQLIASPPITDPIAILYSPQSERIEWLLARRADGKPWVQRSAEVEYKDNPAREASGRVAKIVAHLGLTPRWITRSLIEHGVLRTRRIRVLLLPHAIALSPLEASRIQRFIANGGAVFADVQPGQFDAHGRRLSSPLLVSAVNPLPDLGREMINTEQEALSRLQDTLKKTKIHPYVTIQTLDGSEAPNIDTHIYRNGKMLLIGLQRDDPERNVSGSAVVLNLGSTVYVYDLLHPGPPQHTSQFKVRLDPVTPTIIAISSSQLPRLAIKGPDHVSLGAPPAKFDVTQRGTGPARDRIVHLTIARPDGEIVPAYTTNIVVRRGHGRWRLLTGLLQQTGIWKITITDVVTGDRLVRPFMVAANSKHVTKNVSSHYPS